MTQWLEINIKINDFTYAVREEVNDISKIKDIGIEITNRLHDIVNKREKKLVDKIIDYYKTTDNLPFMCKVRPGSRYWVSNLFDGPHDYYGFLDNKIFKAVARSEDHFKLQRAGWYDILVKKEDVIPQNDMERW